LARLTRKPGIPLLQETPGADRLRATERKQFDYKNYSVQYVAQLFQMSENAQHAHDLLEKKTCYQLGDCHIIEKPIPRQNYLILEVTRREVKYRL